MSDQLKALRSRYEQLQSDNKDLENRIRTNEKKAKEEQGKLQAERNELIQQMTKVQNKETQYRHDLRNRDMQIAKLQEAVKQRVHAQNATAKIGEQHGSFYVSTVPNPDIKFSKISGDQDFHLMISKDQEQNYNRVCEENNSLRDCLRLLQREMLEVVCLKNDVFTQRFKAEHGRDIDNTDKMTAKIESIREELFNMSFEETGKDLIQKFRQNFQRLRDFMGSVDKEIAQMAVFNQRDEPADGEDKNSSSVQQLRLILKNYEALTES